MNQAEILRWIWELSVCNLSDALDRLGIAGAPRGLVPLWHGCGKVAGRAMTMKLVDSGDESPVEGTLRAITTAGKGDLLVIDHGGRLDVNSFGGIAAFTAQRRGLRGVVLDGVTRDVDEMRVLDFPAYGRGVVQQSIRGRCAFGGFGDPISLAGVPVRRGDFVAADENGVVVLPHEQAAELVGLARACAEAEEALRRSIAEGLDPVEAHRRASYEDPGRRRS
ncbi:MAG TPA: RraA family protein [Candidatus Polarisedimenticolia bacterium]|nr:RraA family protein [Candidatus Polarisedimenticolia bacterium]